MGQRLALVPKLRVSGHDVFVKAFIQYLKDYLERNLLFFLDLIWL